MPKLHEFLAVENNLKAQVEKTRTDLANTFEKKRHLFIEKRETFTPVEEGGFAVTENQLDLQSKVMDELDWLVGIWKQSLDTTVAIAQANTKAQATIRVGETTLGPALPPTALLDLEKRINEFFSFLQGVPTLDPAKGFTPDPNRGPNIYKAREDVKVRTKKTQRPLVLAPATKEHPAQVQLISEDVPIGTLRTQEWSGLITPAQKAEMLGRCEALRRAIKEARARANDLECLAPGTSFGKQLFDYVLRGV